MAGADDYGPGTSPPGGAPPPAPSTPPPAPGPAPQAGSAPPDPSPDPSEEGINSAFFGGVILGDFDHDNRSWSKVITQVGVGFIPGVGQVADARDTLAATVHVWQGKEGAWTDLALAGVGWIPAGDIVKAVVKVGRKEAKAAVKVADEVAKHGDDVTHAAKGAAEVAPVVHKVDVVSKTMHLSAETAGTGGIKKISGELSKDGSKWVQIEGELKAPLDRATAPNFNKDVVRGSDIGGAVQKYEVAHVWGPGFGDEAAAGLMLAPPGVNQALQNHGVESRLRELQALAAKEGVTITVSARAESFGREIGKGQDFLKEASYRFEAVMPDGTRRIVGEVNISVPPPGAAGAPVVDVRGGSAGIWSLK